MHDESMVEPLDPIEDESDLRGRAVRRSWVCPGAGSALAGQPVLAVATFASSFAVLPLAVWATLRPSALVLWAFVATGVVSTILWVAEQVAVKRVALGRSGPRLLVSGFLPVSVAVWAGVVGCLVLFFTSYGSLKVGGRGMGPILEQGELFLYRKQVRPGELRRGKVIVYRLSPDSAWGRGGVLMVGRILAGPGDRLAIRDGRYLVNGVGGPPVASTQSYAPVVVVPEAPAEMTVPDGCYFIVQDNHDNAYDSRVLSWAREDDILSTRLYYLRGDSILGAVK